MAEISCIICYTELETKTCSTRRDPYPIKIVHCPVSGHIVSKECTCILIIQNVDLE